MRPVLGASRSILPDMQEFFSFTASSYDAESLTPMLAEKSAEGWSVVSIVAAGTNIVAFLSRESAEGADSASVAEMAADVSVAASPVAAAAVAAAAVIDTPALPAVDTPYVPADSSISTMPAAAPAAATPEAATAEAAIAAAAAAATAANEPAGWATAPENDVADLTAQVAASLDAAAKNTADFSGQVAAEAVVVTEDVAEQAVEATAGAAPESGVPAGWYADPSGRYELRYWDGNAWTEHVSRAGQQFTDAPVA
ncbi:MAG: hypothetical protein ACI91Q_002437 [Gammaproteobacteria bacterium]|jgi:hypothetical protein